MILSGVIAAIVNRAVPDLTEINPPWENVVFQMPMNTLLDQTRRRSVTANGNALVQSATTMLGFPCAYFDGVGDYLSIPWQYDFASGIDNQTIEVWVIPSSTSSSDRDVIGLANAQGVNSFWGIFQSASGKWGALWHDDYVEARLYGGDVVVGKLTHLKFERVGRSMYLYQDGVRVASGTRSVDNSYGESLPLSIGRSGNNDGQYFHGFIGGVGIANWASGQETFLPPVSVFDASSTAGSSKVSDPNFQNVVLAMPFDTSITQDLAGNSVSINTATGNVVLYLPMSGDAGSTSFVDAKGHAVTAVGGAKLSSAKSKYFPTSGDFTAASDYLSLPSSVDYEFGTAPFTIEAWVFLTMQPGSQGAQIFGKNEYGTGSSYVFSITSGLQLEFYFSSIITAYRSTATVPTGQWVHISVSRSGSSLSFAVNGVVNTLTISAAASTETSYVAAYSIGGDTNGDESTLTGYLSELRVVKGRALYVTSFAPPSGQLSADISTDLALSEDRAAFDGSALSGSGSAWLAVANNAKFQFNGDFTISGWVWGNGDKYLFSDWRYGYQTECGCELAVIGGVARFQYNIGTTGGTITHTVALNASAPNHVAVTRKNGVIRVFVNGLGSAPINAAGTLNTNAYAKRIGGRSAVGDTTDSLLSGFADDLFVCNEWAKWDADFYPPIQHGEVQSLWIDQFHSVSSLSGAAYSQSSASIGSAQDAFNGGYWNSGTYSGWVQIVLPNSGRMAISGLSFSASAQNGTYTIRIDGVDVKAGVVFSKATGRMDIVLDAPTTFNSLWFYCSCSAAWHHLNDVLIKK